MPSIPLSPPGSFRADQDQVYGKLRNGLVAAAIFSAVINLLALSSPLFMMQIYDRVLTSRSLPTLVLLALIFGGLLLLMGVVDALRGQLLGRLGNLLEYAYAPRLLRHVLSLTGARDAPASQPLDDLRSVRAVFASQAVTAAFDLPWFPLFLILVFLIHPVLGVVSLVGAVILGALVLRSQRITHARLPALADAKRREVALLQSISRQADAARALGMTDGLAQTWGRYDRDELAAETNMTDRLAVVSAASRAMRLLVQSALLGFGAWLVIRQELSPGVMIASSIMMGRALAPIEMAAAHWQKLAEAHAAYRRLRDLFKRLVPKEDAFALAQPTGHVLLANVFAVPRKPGAPVLNGVSFEVKPGQALGIAGPTAAGKSMLARVLAGSVAPLSGTARLDGVDLDRLDPHDVGRHIGYLPQSVELLPGTIAQNIGRFDPDASLEAVHAAAKLAGVHERILLLPEGYQSPAGTLADMLSVGERQMIGLARAFFGEPPLLVLDAPDANLDPDGQAVLEEALKRARARQRTLVVISHSPRILRHMDHVLMLVDGRVQRMSPRDEFFSAMFQAFPKTRAQGAED